MPWLTTSRTSQALQISRREKNEKASKTQDMFLIIATIEQRPAKKRGHVPAARKKSHFLHCNICLKINFCCGKAVHNLMSNTKFSDVKDFSVIR